MTVIRKPTPIPALQFTGENADAIREMCKAKYAVDAIERDFDVSGDPCLCMTVGDHCNYAGVGEWIICEGYLHPLILDDDKFRELFEEVK